MNYGVIAPVILGLVFTIVGYLKRKEIKKLKQSGIRVDGTVFSVEYEPPTNMSTGNDNYNSNTGIYYPVIRYVTTGKEWVTKRCEIGHYPSKYKEGDTVPVIYDPDKINEFMIDDNSSNIIVHLFWFGILLISIGGIVFAVTKQR
jgi:hypothetical protein